MIWEGIRLAIPVRTAKDTKNLLSRLVFTCCSGTFTCAIHHYYKLHRNVYCMLRFSDSRKLTFEKSMAQHRTFRDIIEMFFCVFRISDSITNLSVLYIVTLSVRWHRYGNYTNMHFSLCLFLSRISWSILCKRIFDQWLFECERISMWWTAYRSHQLFTSFHIHQ